MTWKTFVVVSDIHPDKSTAGFPRFDDVQNAMLKTTKHAIAIKADGYLFLGDLCNPESRSLIRCVGLAQTSAWNLRRHGIPSLWLSGNHDVLEDGHGTSVVDLLRPEMVVSKAPQVVEFGGTLIVCFPYTAMACDYSPEEWLRGFERREDVSLVISHLMLEGIGPGSETVDMARGRDKFLPIDLVKEKFPNARILNGHYHRRQTFRGIEVVGSLCNFTRGDVDNQPVFLEVRVNVYDRS